jgi:error-prone DNA polymerase
MVRGFAQKTADRIVAARAPGSFDSIDDLARRAALNQRDLRQLAAANALVALAGHRRTAHWLVAGVAPTTPLLEQAPLTETIPLLSAPTEGENLVTDYASTGLTLGRHPLALLRGRLKRMRLSSAAELGRFPHGRLARTAGIVTGRQRPGTASGVVFVTLEDETGSMNVIVWRDLVDRQHRELLGSSLMGVLRRRGARGRSYSYRRSAPCRLQRIIGPLADSEPRLSLIARSRAIITADNGAAQL